MKVMLFCAAGMSTSILIGKMEEEAKKKGIDVQIEAYPESQMPKKIPEADVVLLGPQVKFKFKKAEGLCKPLGIPVELINSIDYGMVDGEKVLQQAIRLFEYK